MSSDLYLADLGGSEQVKRSQVHHGGYDKETGTAKGFVMGQNMKEAVNINLGKRGTCSPLHDEMICLTPLFSALFWKFVLVSRFVGVEKVHWRT